MCDKFAVHAYVNTKTIVRKGCSRNVAKGCYKILKSCTDAVYIIIQELRLVTAQWKSYCSSDVNIKVLVRHFVLPNNV